MEQVQKQHHLDKAIQETQNYHQTLFNLYILFLVRLIRTNSYIKGLRGTRFSNANIEVYNFRMCQKLLAYNQDMLILLLPYMYTFFISFLKYNLVRGEPILLCILDRIGCRFMTHERMTLLFIYHRALETVKSFL